MGEQRLYEYDEERKQYRKRYSKNVDTEAAGTDSSSIYARPEEKVATSYRKTPRGANPLEVKKKLKRVFWVLFAIVLVVWLVFVVKFMPDGSGADSEESADIPRAPLKL